MPVRIPWTFSDAGKAIYLSGHGSIQLVFQAGDGHMVHVHSARQWWSLDDRMGTSQIQKSGARSLFSLCPKVLGSLSTCWSKGYLSIRQQNPLSYKAITSSCHGNAPGGYSKSSETPDV